MKGIIIAIPIALILWFLILWALVGIEFATFAVGGTTMFILAVLAGMFLYVFLNKSELQKL